MVVERDDRFRYATSVIVDRFYEPVLSAFVLATAFNGHAPSRHCVEHCFAIVDEHLPLIYLRLLVLCRIMSALNGVKVWDKVFGQEIIQLQIGRESCRERG